MRSGPRMLARVALAVAVGVITAGCGLTHLQDLNFRVDGRLHFLAPRDRSLVHQPVTLRWTMRDFAVAAPHSAPPSRNSGYFAIFVDRAPVRPGQTMKAVASGDNFCTHAPGCPDGAYLAQRQIYTTTNTQFALPQILPIINDKETVQLHAVTIVLMDTAGHRIGESAWEIDLRIRKVGVS